MEHVGDAVAEDDSRSAVLDSAVAFVGDVQDVTRIGLVIDGTELVVQATTHRNNHLVWGNHVARGDEATKVGHVVIQGSWLTRLRNIVVKRNVMADTYFKACTNGFNQLLTRFLAQGEGKVVVLRKEAQINVVARHDVSPYLVKVRRTRKEIVAVII